MELSEKDEAELKKLVVQKLREKGGELSADDKHDIAKDFLKDRKSDENNSDKVLLEHAKTIHSATITRLHKLVDKIEKGELFEGLSAELMPSRNVRGLDRDRWDFSLGDRVVVDLSKEHFKSIMKQTLGWKKRLRNVCGQYGFITDVLSKYDCKTVVYFPDILTSTMIYAGALSKTDKDFHNICSRWSVGDFVKTKRSKKLIKIFQKRLPDFPEKHIGKQGRVIAVTSAGIYVTFNEKSSFVVNPAILLKVDSPMPMEMRTVTDHPKGFRVGMKVTIISNLRKLIINQKEFGGWNWKMTYLAGKSVRISYIKKDGSLIVGMITGRTWRLNFDSAYRDATHVPFLDSYQADDLPFLAGDVVRLKLTASIRTQMVGANVLESCLDLLKLPGKVEGIDDDFDVVVRFANGKKQIMNPSWIQKVSKMQTKRFDLNEIHTSSLKSGDRVRVSSGPPRYVNEILSKMRVNQATRDALTQEAKLLGFNDNEHAVIRYDNGKMIKISAKYLSPAAQVDYDIPQKVGFRIMENLIETSETCIAMEHIERDNPDQDGSVDVFFVISGSPPTVCLRINSAVAKPERVIDRLGDITAWKIMKCCENECNISMPGDVEVDVVYLGQDEPQPKPELDDLLSLGTDNVSHGTGPSSTVKNKETPTNDNQPDVGNEARVHSTHEETTTFARTHEKPAYQDLELLPLETESRIFYLPSIPRRGAGQPVAFRSTEPGGGRDSAHSINLVGGKYENVIINNNYN